MPVLLKNHLPENSMNTKRTGLGLESLEGRRLLAANFGSGDFGSGDSCEPGDISHAAAPSGELISLQAVPNGTLDAPVDLSPNFIPRFRSYHDSDLVQEIDNRVLVVDQNRLSSDPVSLHVFARTDDGGLSPIAQVEVDFQVREMIVAGDQVLLFGNNDRWPIFLDGVHEDGENHRPDGIPGTAQTIVLTINLDGVDADGDVEVVRQEFSGHFRSLVHDDGQVTLVSSTDHDVAIAIYPPLEITSLVRQLEITSDGLHEVASGELPHNGIHQVLGNDLFSASTTFDEIVYLMPAGIANTGEPTDTDENAEIRAPDEPLPPVPSVSVGHYARVDVASDAENDATEEETTTAIVEIDRLELGSGFLTSFEVAQDGQTAVAVRMQHLGTGPITFIDLLDLSDGPMRVFETIELPDVADFSPILGLNYVMLRDSHSNELVLVDTDPTIDLSAENRVRRIEVPESIRLGYRHMKVTDDRLVLWGTRVPVESSPAEEDSGDEDGFDPSEEFEVRIPRFPGLPDPSVLMTVSISQAEIVGDFDVSNGSFSPRRLVLIDSETQRLGFFQGNDAEDEGPQFVFGHLREDGEFDPDGRVELGRWIELDANADRLIVRQADRILEYDWENLSDPTVTPLGDPDPLIEAINDEFSLIAGGEDALLDVLANDNIHHIGFFPPAEIVELIGAPEGTQIVEGVRIRLPAAALVGQETLRFEYVISDGVHRSSAVVEIDVVAAREALVDLALRAVNDAGERLEAVTPGQEFFLEFYAKDLRENGKGVYAAFFDLEIPRDRLQITGPVQYSDGFSGVSGSEFGDHLIDDLGAVSNQIDHPGNAEQSLLRIGVRAVGPSANGDSSVLRLSPESAGALGTETLLRGEQAEVPAHRVRYLPLELTILPVVGDRPLDSNDDGNVTAIDALLVINFLARYGATELTDLPEIIQAGEGEAAANSDLQMLRRLDTNRSGTITALDALVVVNHITTSVATVEINQDRAEEEEVAPEDLTGTVSSDPEKIASFEGGRAD